VRDHATSPATVTHVAELHKFTSGGGWVWHVPLPGAQGNLLSASPNIVRLNGQDVVLVPRIGSRAPFNVRLTAISEHGGLLADQIVSSFSPQTTGGGGDIFFWDWPCYIVTAGHTGCVASFTPPGPEGPAAQDKLAENLKNPFHAVAVFAPAGSAPLIMVSNGFLDLVGVSFNGSAFEEQFRVHDDKRFLLSPPLVWPGGIAMLSTGGFDNPPEVMFAGLNRSTLHAAGPISFAAPAALGNSRFAIVHRFGGVTIMRGAAIENAVELAGPFHRVGRGLE
jgi:hypothetical protein